MTDNVLTHDEPVATNEESKSIKPIQKDTIHQLCSGQVVLSLAVAVKELVENSIDAGATLVEIKLHNQGLDSVDVMDNGCGVKESNLEAMTAKYHTSKLREFVDLQGVETFGFRGEALSSLCSLSDMIITTRHSSTNVGLRIELDHHGKIKKKTPCARQIGTTVTLSNLFSTLPVRKREFARNIKKEFSKMCQILQGYCLVSKGVRIMCTNFNAKGAKSVILATHGSQNYVENIEAVFGSKQVSDLIKIKSPFEENLTLESLQDLNETDSSFQITEEDIAQINSKQFELEGWISSCEHGKGRGSKDRQYFFVNSRPCEPHNIAKLINQIYHRYNLHQFPFVFLNILTERSQVDVNLTPDKRQLLVNNEKILLLAIKKALINTFGNIPSTLKLKNSTLDNLFKSNTNKSVATEDTDDEDSVQANKPAFLQVLSQWKATGDTVGPLKNKNKTQKRKPHDEIAIRTAKMKKIQQYLCNRDSIKQQEHNVSMASYKSDSDSDSNCNVSVFDSDKIMAESKEFDVLLQNNLSQKQEELVETVVCKTNTLTPNIKFYELKPNSNKSDEDDEEEQNTNDTSKEENKYDSLFAKQENSNEEEIEEAEEKEDFREITEPKTIVLDQSDDDEEDEITFAPTSEIQTSIEKIREAVQLENELEATQTKLKRLKFKSKIDPNQNKLAEEELQLEISKDMFAKMEIVGQFNKGFIVVSMGSDLLIVDQHASDEKYNFEELQKSTVLQYQTLVVPQTLELTADNEMILIDNLEVFEKNGFKFEIDENGPPTKRIKLLGKPFSQRWEFGKDDIDELIFMLKDAPKGTICRPSRIRAMFASRACRKSVMIGDILNQSAMRKLLNHMGEIDQPWNCPHGRPTMRHLVNIEMLVNSKKNDGQIKAKLSENDDNDDGDDDNENQHSDSS